MRFVVDPDTVSAPPCPRVVTFDRAPPLPAGTPPHYPRAMNVTHDYLIRSDADPRELVAHVMHRVAGVAQRNFDEFYGVRVDKGVFIASGTKNNRLVTVLCGQDAGGSMAMRVLVTGAAAGKAAVVTFPVVVTIALAIGLFGWGPESLFIALVPGVIAGALSVAGVYQLIRRGILPTPSDTAGADAIAVRAGREFSERLSSLGGQVIRQPVRLLGLDEGEPDPELFRTMTLELAGLAQVES
ncbi:MAG: hypothetical protein ACJA1R_000635 [Flavobacteriales bacterium]